ncbi:MAG: DUF262 domain-containing protein [Treponema sp.]|nr:DUF262 domain-containing protein [Treponema sp.]
MELDNRIDLRTIDSLKAMKFYIPNYQRGYRWTEQQVKDLLNDIYDFMKKSHSGDDFYCIQPLVVKESIVEDKKEEFLKKLHELSLEPLLDNTRNLINQYTKWEVIDGQQRLTTICLLLTCLGYQHFYSVEYQTREKSREMLENILNYQSSPKLDIDAYHMVVAKDTIMSWFEEHNQEEEDLRNRFARTLLHNVKFIWYESVDENPIDVFTRLNIGKISLTNAELIKALFLNRSNFKDKNDSRLRLKQNEISSQWDNIEYTFQNDEFWLFLNPKDYKPVTRIELIFNIICENDLLKIFRKSKDENSKDYAIIDYKKMDKKCGKDDNRLFRYFYEFFSDSEKILSNSFDIQKFWNDNIQTVFNAFVEWYSDITLYHYIGFILNDFYKKIDINKHLKNLKEIYEEWITSANKKGFENDYLIKKKIIPLLDKCKDLSKQFDNKRDTLPILLLHNIETIIQQNEAFKQNKDYGIGIFTKFPFHLFKREGWDVEHINSFTTNNEEEESTQNEFLLNSYLSVDELTQNEIKLFFEKKENAKTYETIKNRIEQQIGKPDEWTKEEKNKIWNYTLLDSSTNRSYGNMIFSGKRRIIAAKDRGLEIGIPNLKDGKIIVPEEKPAKSAFVPICTKNVFMKYYSSNQGSANYWLKEIDAEAYKKDIIDKLKDKFGVCDNQEEEDKNARNS